MAITDEDRNAAEARMQALREAGHAVSARYDARSERLVVDLSTGMQIAISARRIEGLSGASSDDLNDIVISPTGLGLHWPKLDADIYVPGLLQGIFGSRKWMAAQLGMTASDDESPSRIAASRGTGRKIGKSRKTVAH